MPVWNVTEPFISLWLTDEPLGYQPAIGPRISFGLDYNQRDTTAGSSQNTFSVGHQWECSWLSYVTQSGNTTTVNYSGGGQATYNGSNNSNPVDNRNNTQLGGGTTNGFTVSYPDGQKDFYGFIVTNAAGVFQQAFLSQRFNAQGQSFTLNYAAYDPSAPVIRLQTVVDGDGRTNRIFYNSTNAYSTNLISSVVDPFGRTTLLAYDNNGNLTNITDVATNSSSINYWSNGWPASMITPYGTTSFAITDGTNSAMPNGRSILVTKPDNSHELYLYTETATGQPNSYPPNAFPNAPSMTGYATQQGPLSCYNSFHWGPRQFEALSTTNIASFTANDYLKARMQHWKLDNSTPPLLVDSLEFERDPSPDSTGMVEGQKTWYYYSGGSMVNIGVQCLPLEVALVLPDGNTAYVDTPRNSWGNVLASISAYPLGSGGNLYNNARTNLFSYAGNGIDVIAVTNALGVQVSSNSYTNHQVLAHYDASNELTSCTYNTNQQVTSVTLPNGLVATNIYGASNLLWKEIVVGFATNTFTYTNDLVFTHTDARGLTTTNTWDNLNRLTSTVFPDGSSISDQYTWLDLTANKDRMGNWTYFGYDNLRRNTAVTNALNNVTLYGYYTDGALKSIQDAANNLTRFNYDNQENLINTVYADGYSIFKTYNLLRQVVTTSDSAGNSITNTYNDQGLITTIQNAAGTVATYAYDNLNRVTNSMNANGISINTAYDNLNRPLTRTYPDNGAENFGYTFNIPGATSYKNQIGNVTLYAYDAMGRKTNEVSVGVTTNRFTYDGAGELLTLTDGRNQTTTWHYDTFGRVTNKVDAANVVDFVYQYDADNRLKNRWTPATGNTTYAYDAVGNRTNINYGGASSISFTYDVLNRMTNMVDGVGTTVFSYNAAGELLSDGGLWPNDTVTYTYNNRRRGSLSVGSWNQTYGYDNIRRLTSIISPAGTFGYQYPGSRPSTLVSRLTLPNSAYITNAYDSVGRLQFTGLANSLDHVLDGYTYAYNQFGQRTNIVRDYGLMNSSASAGYDAIGQLTSWTAKELGGAARLNEQLGYAYDAAGNLKQRTNNALVQTFNVDAANALTNIARAGTLTVSGNTPAPASSVTVNGQPALAYADFTFASGNGFTLADGQNSFTNIANNYSGTVSVTNTITANLPASVTLKFDANGNLTNSGGARSASPTIYAYDAENQLTNVTVAGQWREDYVYDGLNRRRITRNYAWQSGIWNLQSEIHFIYDGKAVIQEWNNNNVAQVTYTRGLDLGGGLQRAGGIGGLLARADANGPTFYHADGNGNITSLMDVNQYMVARYLYDPFGKQLGKWGGLADANVYRFSSKEYDANSGLYYYHYRFYDPNLQRWLNRDPGAELNGLNLYAYVFNNPVNFFDPLGLSIGSNLAHAALSTAGVAAGVVIVLLVPEELTVGAVIAVGYGLYSTAAYLGNVIGEAAGWSKGNGPTGPFQAYSDVVGGVLHPSDISDFDNAGRALDLGGKLLLGPGDGTSAQLRAAWSAWDALDTLAHALGFPDEPDSPYQYGLNPLDPNNPFNPANPAYDPFPLSHTPDDAAQIPQDPNNPFLGNLFHPLDPNDPLNPYAPSNPLDLSGLLSKDPSHSQCFVAGTLVLTKDGFKPIQDIQIGEQVWSFDEETGAEHISTVQDKYVNSTDSTLKIYVGNTVIETTSTHPFWVESIGWKTAQTLMPGDKLICFGKDVSVVQAVEAHMEKTTVYNLEVQDFHTYFVSPMAVGVHNRCSK